MSQMNSLNRILQQNRKKNFVGRDNEIQFFKSIIVEQELSYLLVYIYGIGGQGKSSLLRSYADICEENGTPYIFLDGRHLDANPQSFEEAFLNNCPFCKENFIEEIGRFKKK